MTKYEPRFDLDVKFGDKAEQWVGLLGSEARLEVKSDRLWHKTGNMFMEISRDGKPSGLATSESEYLVYVLWKDNGAKSAMVFDLPHLLQVLSSMYNQGEIRKIKGGDGGRTEGYLLPLDKVGRVQQLMQGIDKGTPAESHDTVIITTDGSFRSGNNGGAHAILECFDGVTKTKKWHDTITSAKKVKDSYEAELMGIVQSLRHLRYRNERLSIELRCDHQGIVDMINSFERQKQSYGKAEVSPTMPCKHLWDEFIEMSRIHSIGAVHTPYSKTDPRTVECHEESTTASDNWQKRAGRGKGWRL